MNAMPTNAPPPESAPTQLTRRGFLRWLTSGALLAGLGLSLRAMFQFLEPPAALQPPPQQMVLTRQEVEQAALPLFLPEVRAWLIQEGGQLIALDAICPHLGCTVHETSSGFACPCHGSRFDEDGDLEHGPAPRGLARLHLEIQQDRIVITRSL